MSKKLTTVLFDLDGTLVDSALDFHYCLNLILAQNKRSLISLEELKTQVGNGTDAMLNLRFSDLQADALEEIKSEFLDLYQQNVDLHTRPFPGILELLDLLDKHYIQWGIVTNKHTYLTNALLSRIQLLPRCACVVSGDTLNVQKPSPEPILYACKQIGVLPEECIYIGDCERDIAAGNAAGMPTIAACFGYANCTEDDFRSWNATYYVNSPDEIAEIIYKKVMLLEKAG